MAESSNSEKEPVLTMCDVLEEEQELEEDANAVLGGSDDTNCSYYNGYVPRQALYACMTCCPEENAGVCLACCYACHDKHEVVELYTKRDFRCDCGNSKFKGKTCTLTATKDALNVKNQYNHNFRGVYCTCRRPYPDLEDNVADEMIQCIMCEDWFHTRHLGTSIPEEYSEMICKSCMDSHEFLHIYHKTYDIHVEDSPMKTRETTKREQKKGEESSKVDQVQETDKEEPSDIKKEKPVVKLEMNLQNGSASCSTADTNISNEMKPINMNNETIPKSENTQNGTNSSSTEEPGMSSYKLTDNIRLKKLENNGTQCIFKNLNTTATSSRQGSAFWPDSWRSDLCHCPECMAMYAAKNCLFLLNSEDTIQAYESRGKNKTQESQYDKGLSALGQLDRVKQMEAIRAYTSMKGELLDYLKGFADNKRTVCESDIKEFFEGMAKKKKLNNGIPHFCR